VYGLVAVIIGFFTGTEGLTVTEAGGPADLALNISVNGTQVFGGALLVCLGVTLILAVEPTYD
jgi:hypothetical protein